MKTIARFTLFAALLAIFVPSAFAQTEAAPSRTVELTEQQINDADLFDDRPRLNLSDVFVDLQPGQVTISGTISGERFGEDAEIIVILVPEVFESGGLMWQFISVTVDGAQATEEQIQAVNAIITNSWRNYIRSTYEAGRITDITITDDTLTLTLDGQRRERPEDLPIEVEDGVATVTLTEEQINETYRIQRNRRIDVADVFVDLQADQVVISATWTLPNVEPFTTQAIYTAALADGDVTWTLVDLTFSSADTVQRGVESRVSSAIDTSWVGFWRRLLQRGDVTSLVITETEIVYTVTR